MAVQTKIQVRRDTAANWTSTNPTLAAGEFGFETNTGKVKVGTGSTAWVLLGYVNPAGTTTPSTAAAFRTSVYSNNTTSASQVISFLNLANTAIAGEVYRIKVMGYRTGTNNTGATFRVNVDGVTALTLTQTASAVASGFTFEGLVTIMTLGVTGTAWTQGVSTYGATITASNNTASTTISTGSDSTIELTLASGSSSNTYFVTNAIIEMLN